MQIKNLQIFIRWAKRHEIEFEYLPYNAKTFEELEYMNIEPVEPRYSDDEPVQLPELVADFSNLKSLEFCWFQLEQLPTWLEGCQSLEVLSIVGNDLGLIPTWIERLPRLKKLVCSSNGLYIIPVSSASLIELDCSFNDLEGFGSWDGDLPNLVKLDCTRNRIGEIPKSIGKLHALEELVIKEASCLKRLPSQLLELDKLRVCSIISDNLDEESQEIKRQVAMNVQARKELHEVDKRAWLDALRENTRHSYRSYLEAFPEGNYVESVWEKLKGKNRYGSTLEESRSE